jgi:lysine-arginine-ornithine-binding protein
MKRALAVVCSVLCLAVLAGTAHAAQPLKMGMECDYQPFQYKDKSGKLVGWEVDLAQELFKRMNMPYETVCMEWDGLLPALLAGKIDAVMSALSITAERQAKVDFTIPYRDSTGRFVAKKGANLALFRADGTPNPDGLKGKTVGAQRATTYERYLKAKFPGVNVNLYGADSEMLLDLQAGRVDAVLHGPIKLSANFLELAQGKDYEFTGPELIEPEFFGVGTGIALRKGNADLVAKLNAAFKSTFEDGTFKQLNLKYWKFSVLPSVWK